MLAFVLFATLAQTTPPLPALEATPVLCAVDGDCRADERCGGHRSLGDGQWSRGTCRSRAAVDQPLEVVDPLDSQGPRFEFRGTVPEGFTLVEEPRLALIVPGAVLLGAGYALTTFIGIAVGIPSAAFPLLGPIFFAAQAWQPGGSFGVGFLLDALIVLLVAVELAAQVTGAVLLITGLAKPKRWLERLPVTIVPSATANTMGFAVVGRF